MAVQVTFTDPWDAQHCVAALLTVADELDENAPLLARRYRVIADAFGDAVDTLPVPSGWGNTPR